MSDFFCLLFPAKCKTYASHRRSYSLAWVASRDARTHRGWRAPAPSPHTHTHTHTHTTTPKQPHTHNKHHHTPHTHPHTPPPPSFHTRQRWAAQPGPKEECYFLLPVI